MAVVAVLVGALVLGVTATLLVARRPLPSLEGSVQIDGLDGEVQILRDDLGIPHIYATTDHDLFLAQGYVHAQDRFFEMDLRRHLTAGRLSELVGENETAREWDIVARTLGMRAVAEQEFELLDEETQGFLEAYSAGVNTYLGGREASELGIEYTLLSLSAPVAQPEDWNPVDSISWLKTMGWDLLSSYDVELQRAITYGTLLDLQRVEELFPSYNAEANSPILPASEQGPVEDSAETVEASFADPAASEAFISAMATMDAGPPILGEGEGLGSNSFVVSGSLTESGKPLLANDPHLGVSMPGVWHQIGLHCVELTDTCTFDVSGFSFSGLPGVVIGHNQEVSWGLTNMMADVSDFYLERVNPEGTYQAGGGVEPLVTRTETINVAGGDPFTIEVSSTAHGPIVSGILPVDDVSGIPVPAGSPTGGLDGYAVSLAWTALTPGRSMEAIFTLNRAATPDDVAAAAAELESPAQAIVFATTDGDIGFQAPGLIPVRSTTISRAIPTDGSWPRPGWDPAYDWQGFVPAAEMPSVLNPEEGFIVAANQAVLAPGVLPLISADSNYGFRAQRIRTLLEEAAAGGMPVTVADAEAIMMDSAHPLAERLVPIMLRVPIEDPFVAEAVDMLEDWQAEGYPNDVDSAGAAFFNVVVAALMQSTFADELPPEAGPTASSRWMQVTMNLLADPQNEWWDDTNTRNVTEERDETLLRAIETARAQLTNTLDKDPEAWNWGDLHQLRLTHAILTPDVLPGPLAQFLNPAPFGVAGSSESVNATAGDYQTDENGRFTFYVTSGPSMRMVVDLSDLDASTWVNATGNSGHPSSGDYANQIGAWTAGRTYPWAYSPEAVEEAAEHTLTLTPGE